MAPSARPGCASSLMRLSNSGVKRISAAFAFSSTRSTRRILGMRKISCSSHAAQAVQTLSSFATVKRSLFKPIHYFLFCMFLFQITRSFQTGSQRTLISIRVPTTIRSTANTCLSLSTGRLWARRTPKGAVTTLAIMIPSSAGR